MTEPFENAMKSGESTLQITVQIIRAATGKVEDYTLTVTPIPELTKEN